MELSPETIWNTLSTHLAPAIWDLFAQAVRGFRDQPRWALQVAQDAASMDSLVERLSLEVGWALGALVTEVLGGLDIEAPAGTLSLGQRGLVLALVPLLIELEPRLVRRNVCALVSEEPFVTVLLGDDVIVRLGIAGDPRARGVLSPALYALAGWVRSVADLLRRLLMQRPLRETRDAVQAALQAAA